METLRQAGTVSHTSCDHNSHLKRGISTTIMRGAPLFPVAVGLIAGVVLDRAFFCHPAVYLTLFVLASVAVTAGPLCGRRRVRAAVSWVLVGFAAGCTGGMLHLRAVRTVPSSSIEHFTAAEGRISRLAGLVVSPPRLSVGSPNPFARWTYRSDRTVFLLEAESLAGREGDIAVTGRVRVSVGEVVLDLGENERVEVFGWLYPMKPPRNPGSFDWAAFHRRQGVVAGFACRHRENVRRIDAPSGDAGADARRRASFVVWLRTTVRGLLTDDLAAGSEEEASLLEAMILGHRSGLDRRLNDVFIRAGCIHFLAVSGVHVVIVMFFVRLLCRCLMCGPRTVTWAMMMAVIMYAVIAEPRPPILRASTIAVLYCIARLLGRHRACLNWISASAIVLLIVQPAMVFDVGFQLSFAACVGVSYLTPALLGGASVLRQAGRRMVYGDVIAADEIQPPASSIGRDDSVGRRGKKLRAFARRYVVVGIAVTVGAWLATLPIVAWHFHRIQPWGALNSFLVLPLVTIVMGLGFAKLFATLLAPGLGQVLSGWLAATDSLLIRCVEHLGMLPGASLTTMAPPWWLVLPYYGFLLSFVWRFLPDATWPWGRPADEPQREHEPGRGTSRGPAGGVCLASLVILSTATLGWCWPTGGTDRLVVTVLSVGAGSATVIELPDGSTVLYDAGSRAPYDVGRNTVVPFLRHRGIRRVDRIYLSHPNLDHFSGVPSIVDEIETGPIVVNPYFEPRSGPSSPSRHLLRLMKKRGHPVEVLDLEERRWTLGGVTFETLWPPPSLTAERLAGDRVITNDTSTVLRLSYAGRSILLTGDIGDRPQRALLEHARVLERDDLHADVLVLPHHGSVRSSLREFIEAVGADVVIRSASERMEETFNGLPQIVGATRLYNTADVGAVRVVLDAEGIVVSPMSLPDP